MWLFQDDCVCVPYIHYRPPSNLNPTPTQTHKSLGPQEQLNIAYTITAPASTLPAPGQFFVESAAFCPSTTTTVGGGKQQEAGAEAGEGAKDAVSGVLNPIVPAGGEGNGGQRRRQRRWRALRVSDKAAAEAADAEPAAAVESRKAVDDNFLQNPLDQRWYVQAQTRLNNTDAKRGRCNVQFKVRIGFRGLGHPRMCGRKPNALTNNKNPPTCDLPNTGATRRGQGRRGRARGGGLPGQRHSERPRGAGGEAGAVLQPVRGAGMHVYTISMFRLCIHPFTLTTPIIPMANKQQQSPPRAVHQRRVRALGPEQGGAGAVQLHGVGGRGLLSKQGSRGIKEKGGRKGRTKTVVLIIPGRVFGVKQSVQVGKAERA